MRKIQLFFMTYQGLRVKNAIIGVGASLVLLGALFKIMHWPGAGFMLIVGMCIEAFIFFFQGVILPPHKDYHWEKVFPGLDVAPELEEEVHGEGEGAALAPGKGISPLQALLQQPQLPPETMEKLKEAINRIGETIYQLKDITEAGAATKEFAENTREVASLMKEMESAYSDAIQTIQEIAGASEATRHYREGMEQLSSSINELSEMYPKEAEAVRERLQTQQNLVESIRDASENMKVLAENTRQINDSLQSVGERLSAVAGDGDAISRLYTQLENLTEDLQRVVEATRQYREGMAQLAKNISLLNRVYGNMVSALGIQQTQE